MTFSKIQTLGQLRSHLISNTAPAAELAQRAGQMALDETQHLMLSRITTGRELPGSLLWQRIAEHLRGQSQAAALTFAAICAHNAGHFHLSATIITRHDTLARTGHADDSPLIEVLKLDRRTARHLAETSSTRF